MWLLPRPCRPARGHALSLDGLTVSFLFFWMMGVMTELQRSEVLSIEKLFHFPISPSSAFLINYLSSLVSLSLILFFPAMIGLAIASVDCAGTLDAGEPAALDRLPADGDRHHLSVPGMAGDLDGEQAPAADDHGLPDRVDHSDFSAAELDQPDLSEQQASTRRRQKRRDTRLLTSRATRNQAAPGRFGFKKNHSAAISAAPGSHTRNAAHQHRGRCRNAAAKG